jgi:hypothetical protein
MVSWVPEGGAKGSHRGPPGPPELSALIARTQLQIGFVHAHGLVPVHGQLRSGRVVNLGVLL